MPHPFSICRCPRIYPGSSPDVGRGDCGLVGDVRDPGGALLGGPCPRLNATCSEGEVAGPAGQQLLTGRQQVRMVPFNGQDLFGAPIGDRCRAVSRMHSVCGNEFASQDQIGQYHCQVRDFVGFGCDLTLGLNDGGVVADR